jgi:hypothetical protein
LTDFRAAVESTEYAACSFSLNGISICFRVAKTTPVKVGQFVTLWKRFGTGPIQPFDWLDGFDFYVISTRHMTSFGQFVFPRSVLRDRDILSRDGHGGKRAMRVYPPWDAAMSEQARRTQRWQLDHFLDTSEEVAINRSRSQLLHDPSRA